jgi:hypothetical protein
VESPEETSVEGPSCEFREHGPTEPCFLGDQYPRSLCSNFTMDPLDVFVAVRRLQGYATWDFVKGEMVHGLAVKMGNWFP